MEVDSLSQLSSRILNDHLANASREEFKSEQEEMSSILHNPKKVSSKERLRNQHNARKFTEIKLLKERYDVPIITIAKRMKISYSKLK